MNAKQVVAAGLVAAMLGFGPTVASADPYFGLFWGKGVMDISRNDLNALSVDLTLGIGGSSPTGTSDLNDMDSIWGAQVGYRFNRFVAAEIGYVDLGKSNYVANLTSTFTFPDEIDNPPGSFPDGTYNYQSRGRFLSAGPTIAVLGIIPIGERFDIYGRGGLYFADTRFRVRFEIQSGLSREWKAGTQELFGGLGFAWNINQDYALRVEGTYFLDVGDDDRTGEVSVGTAAIGLLFR